MNDLDITIDRDMLTEAIQSSAMLVTLAISAWTPVRVDRELAGDVANARSAEDSAFSVRKNRLIGGDTYFKAASKAQEQFRLFHYRRTLPFGACSGMQDRGPRLLANDYFFTYLEVLAKARTEMDEWLRKAVDHYDESIEAAKRNLGTSFDATDYPDKMSLTSRFGIEVDFTPVPDGRAFRGLPDDTLELLSRFTTKNIEQKAQAASQDVTERVRAYLERLTGRLGALDASLGVEGVRKAAVRGSLFTEAKEIADLIGAFPFIQTGALTEAMDLLRDVSRYEATDLEDEATRASLQARSADVFACF